MTEKFVTKAKYVDDWTIVRLPDGRNGVFASAKKSVGRHPIVHIAENGQQANLGVQIRNETELEILHWPAQCAWTVLSQSAVLAELVTLVTPLIQSPSAGVDHSTLQTILARAQAAIPAGIQPPAAAKIALHAFTTRQRCGPETIIADFPVALEIHDPATLYQRAAELIARRMALPKGACIIISQARLAQAGEAYEIDNDQQPISIGQLPHELWQSWLTKG